MFCARILRSPKRFECSTGSNISTSTPVSDGKQCMPDEPNQSPIEKSNDNSKEFGSINNKANGLPYSPLATGVHNSYLRSKRVLNLINEHSTPIARNSHRSVNNPSDKTGEINSKECEKLLSKKTIDSKKYDWDERPIHCLRTSPRNLTKSSTLSKERSKSSSHLKYPKHEKENHKSEITTTKTGNSRSRTKSHIPTRRRSVSLQDLAKIQSAKDSNKIASGVVVKGNNVSKNSSAKTLTNKVFSKELKPCTEESSKSKINSEAIISVIECKKIATKSQKNISINKQSEKNDPSVKKSNANQKANVPKSVPNQIAVTEPINKKNAPKKHSALLFHSKANNVKTNADPKTNGNDGKSKTEPLAHLGEKNKNVPVSKDKVKEQPTQIASKQSEIEETLKNKSKVWEKHTEKELSLVPGKSQPKNAVPVVQKKNSSTPSDEADKIKKAEDKPSKKNGKDEESHKKASLNAKSDAESKVSSPKSGSKCVIGTKIFAQEKISKCLSDNLPQVNVTTRTSCGSQRSSDTFQVSKTSFVKRKLYSQCSDFNNDSDSNQESSFLAAKDEIRNIYCLKKKNGNSLVDAKSIASKDSSKNDNGQNGYSLRNTKKTSNTSDVKNTCKFVTKILEDINLKSKPVESKDKDVKSDEVNKMEAAETNEKSIKEKPKSDVSSNDIFDKCPGYAKSGRTKRKSQRKSKKSEVQMPTNKDATIKKQKKCETTSSSRKSVKTSKAAQLMKDHSSDLIIVKSNRSAKTNAIDRIHNWSANLNSPKRQAKCTKASKEMLIVDQESYSLKSGSNDPIISNSSHVTKIISKQREHQPKRIIVNRECSYYLRRSGSNDPNISLSPHIKKAISKLKEQQPKSSHRPVRRSLEVSVNKKQTVVLSRDSKSNGCIESRKDLPLEERRSQDKIGTVMAFKNGQLVTCDYVPTCYLQNSLDDSFYSLRPRNEDKKIACVVKKSTVQNSEMNTVKTINDASSISIVNKCKDPYLILSDPCEPDLLKQYSAPQSNETSRFKHYCDINNAILDTTDKHNSRQLLPYNTSMHAVVPRPHSIMSHCEEFKMPMGNYMPGVPHKRTVTSISCTTKSVRRQYENTITNMSYSNRSAVYSNPLKSLPNNQQYRKPEGYNFDNHRSYTQGINMNFANRVPDFIRNTYQPTTSYQSGDMSKNSYSFCARGVELMRNESIKPYNAPGYSNANDRTLAAQNDDPRKRKCNENIGCSSPMSKKTRYDDDMSMCSNLTGNAPISSTRIYNQTKTNKIPESMKSNQFVCQFIIRGPLQSELDGVNRRITNSLMQRINKPKEVISTNRQMTGREEDESNFSNDANETVVSVQTHVPTVVSSITHHTNTKYSGHVGVQSGEMTARHNNRLANDTRQILDERQLRCETDHSKIYNGHKSHQIKPGGQRETDTDGLSSNKRYKFSSEDVYNFGKKPKINEALINNDTFYFKGLYNRGSDISGIQMQNTISSASSNVDDLFRKPSSLYRVKMPSHSSILEKYHNFHTMHKTPKKKDRTRQQTDNKESTPVSKTVEKVNIQSRNMVSPWRLL